MTLDETRCHWFRLWTRAGIALSDRESDGHLWVQETFEDLCRRYGEAHRRYHTLGHIAKLIETSMLVEEYIAFPVEFELALFLHDVIYDARPELAKFNEERSRRYMRELVEESKRFTHYFFEKGRIPRLGGYIMATKHTGKLIEYQKQLIADLDLVTLGAPWEEYLAYGKAIRFEFQYIPEQRFQTGRIEFLRRMLARRRIYYTDLFYDMCEK